MSSPKPHVLLLGQTPPPWHGQAVATQILFEHDWPGFEAHRLRMEFSEEMIEVGRFQWKKIGHLFELIRHARGVLKENPGCILFYPPASAKWIPFLRDVAFLCCVRHLAGATVFIYHASGLPLFVGKGPLRRLLGRISYQDADVALEVAQEPVSPHEAFVAKTWQWCPCAIRVPEHFPEKRRSAGAPSVILFVGSLQEGKGIVEILRTASILKQSGSGAQFRFRIVGKWFSNEFEEDIRHLRSELELEEMVELTGQLTGDEKWRAYSEADVFFFPTHYASEATPIVLMEALGAGLPVVTTNWAGIPAMLDGCGTARLLPIRSPESYASALLDLRHAPSDAAAIGEESKAFYRSRFLPERFVERVADAFRTAAGFTCAAASPEAPAAELSPDIRERGKIRITTYLADQNPGHDRSFGISRMSQVVIEALQKSGRVSIRTIASKTSQQAPECVDSKQILPWGTRRKWIRLVTDHFHPVFENGGDAPELHYFPKGYLPLLDSFCSPSVVTIHDTIIQYDEDHYPKWRNRLEYTYWAMMLKHTLRQADRIMTVSESSKRQIQTFMKRHAIPPKEITVTYEPCLYEDIPQPQESRKENYVIHLASCEPHKRTSHLIRWWHEAENSGRDLPTLHLIGTVPPEVAHVLQMSRTIVKRPFLEDKALLAAYLGAKALILPSEIEGFGLPALEAYYLGTPVCYVKGTSVEEILGIATDKGGFSLDSAESLFQALEQVLEMKPQEIRDCGLKLRSAYASERVAARMIDVFLRAGEHRLQNRS